MAWRSLPRSALGHQMPSSSTRSWMSTAAYPCAPSAASKLSAITGNAAPTLPRPVTMSPRTCTSLSACGRYSLANLRPCSSSPHMLTGSGSEARSLASARDRSSRWLLKSLPACTRDPVSTLNPSPISLPSSVFCRGGCARSQSSRAATDIERTDGGRPTDGLPGFEPVHQLGERRGDLAPRRAHLGAQVDHRRVGGRRPVVQRDELIGAQLADEQRSPRIDVAGRTGGAGRPEVGPVARAPPDPVQRDDGLQRVQPRKDRIVVEDGAQPVGGNGGRPAAVADGRHERGRQREIVDVQVLDHTLFPVAAAMASMNCCRNCGWAPRSPWL